MTTQIPGTMGLEYRVVVGGLASSTARAIIETPFEYAKVRGQTRQEWHIRQAYTGFGACWVRCTGLMTSYFMMIDTLRRNTDAFKRKSTQFLASGSCATLAFLIVWPFETLKNQIQAQTKGIGNTWGEKFRFMINKYGYRGLYRGALPGCMSIFMRNGAAMTVMQHTQKLITDLGIRKPVVKAELSSEPQTIAPRNSMVLDTSEN